MSYELNKSQFVTALLNKKAQKNSIALKHTSLTCTFWCRKPIIFTTRKAHSVSAMQSMVLVFDRANELANTLDDPCTAYIPSAPDDEQGMFEELRPYKAYWLSYQDNMLP